MDATASQGFSESADYEHRVRVTVTGRVGPFVLARHGSDVTSAWLRLQLSRVLLGQPRLIVLNFHVRSAYKSPDRSI